VIHEKENRVCQDKRGGIYMNRESEKVLSRANAKESTRIVNGTTIAAANLLHFEWTKPMDAKWTEREMTSEPERMWIATDR
jgi:hypothetical protein